MTPAPSYDLFVSYADADRTWVEGYLLDALKAAGVAYHSEDAFALGVPRLLEFERAIKQSKRTLLIISPAYLADTFAQFVDVLVNSYGLETATWPVIPLLLHPADLPPRLSQLTKLDATDAERWPAALERLCATLQRTPPPPPPPPVCPYPGMAPFGESDSVRFFGREREVQELLERLRLHPFLAVIGPSGSGKSSLVFAGLLPKLKASRLFGDGAWLIRTLRPGTDPQAALCAAIGGDAAAPAHAVAELLLAQPAARRLVLVIDQFEEVFTVAGAAAAPFQQTLLRLAETPGCYMLLTVRADFYADLMASSLWHKIQAHRVEVAPLDEQGLRQAVMLPAEAVGVFVETALVERLSADAAGEPGVLPLVQETLVLLWERLERRFLPLSAYELLALPRSAYADGVGRTGLQVAMARRADAALADLVPDQQAIARRIFLRLIQFGEGRADTRRQQPVDKLRSTGDDLQMFEQTLRHLTVSRLLTLSGESTTDQRPLTTDDQDSHRSSVVGRRSSVKVDIAHEALIAGWPMLHGWLNERRAAEGTRRRLEDKAAEWIRLGQSSGGLLDEVELAEAERWLAGADAADLGVDAGLPALVKASQAQIEAEHRVARRRLSNTIAGLAVGLILVTTLAIWGGLNAQSAGNSEATAVASLKGAVTAQANAETRRVEAENAKATAVAETKRAEQEARSARRALSGQLAVQAYAALNTEHPQLSLLLAVEALNVTTQKQEPRVPAAEETFRQVLASVGGRILGDPEGAVGAIATSPNSRWVVTTAGPVARLWDLTATVSPAAPRLLLGHKNDITRVVISLDNHWLVTSNTSEPARLWDLNAADPNATSRLLEDSNGPVAISPDSRWLATTSPDKTAHLWDLKSNAVGSKPYILRGLEDGNEITTIGFSPNSYWLVTASGHTGTHYYRDDDTTAQLWDLRSANPSSNPHILRGHTMGITSVAFSYDSHWLVTASGASNTHTGQLDGTPRLWNLNGSDPAADPISLPNNIGPISVVAFSPDGHWLATGNGGESFGLNPSDTTGRVWDLTNAPRIADPIVLTGHTSSMSKISFSSDSRWLVTGDNGAGDRSKDSVRLWDLNYSPPAAQSQVLLGHDPVASQDGNLIVTLSDATAYVWDLTAFETTVAPRIVRGHEGAIKDAAISPDLHWLVTSGADNTARLWNLMTVDSVANPLVLPVAGDRDTGVISSDNHWLVDGVDENIARLWDLTAADPIANPRILRGHEEPISAIALSPDQHWLVTASFDSTARLWDLTAADPTANPRILRGHEGAVSAIAFSPAQHWLATAGFDGTARLWDLTAADPTANPRILHAGKQALFTLAISLDSHWLVSGNDKTTSIWDLTAANPATTLHTVLGYQRAISSDSHWLVTDTKDGSARLWDLTAADPTTHPQILLRPEEKSAAFAISPDSHWLVIGSDDHNVRLWDLSGRDSTANPRVLRGHAGAINAVAFSPDNHWLATAGGFDLTTSTWDTTVRLWDLTAPDRAVQPIILSGHEQDVTVVAFSPDTHWLVTGGSDKTVRLWDLTAPDVRATGLILHGHTEFIDAISFSADSHWLVTGSYDHTARIWNLRLNELVDLACRTAGRNLTDKEWSTYFPGQPYPKICPNLPPGDGVPPNAPAATP